MIVSEGILIGAWLALWATIWFALKLFARNSWLSTTAGVLSL